MNLRFSSGAPTVTRMAVRAPQLPVRGRTIDAVHLQAAGQGSGIFAGFNINEVAPTLGRRIAQLAQLAVENCSWAELLRMERS